MGRMRSSAYDSEENSGDYMSDDVSDKTVSFKEIESVYSSDVEDPDEEENANQVIRVYDARYKIPRNTNLVDIEKKFANRQEELAKKKNRHKCGCLWTPKTCLGRCCLGEKLMADAKEVICFKKSVHAITLLLMSAAMGMTIAAYIYGLIQIQQNNYFLARAKAEITREVDFEPITTTEVQYFLFNNATYDVIY